METMTKSLAKIWARKIHSGERTVSEVRERYGETGYNMVKEAYLVLYGIDLDTIDE